MPLNDGVTHGGSPSNQILEALTGELPCHASPNWEVSDKKENLPKHNSSAMTEHVPEEASRIFFALTQEDA